MMRGEIEVVGFVIVDLARHSQELEIGRKGTGSPQIRAKQGHADAGILDDGSPGFD